MKPVRNGIIRYWVMTGMLFACLLMSCGFFMAPVLLQLMEIHKKETMPTIAEPPLGSDRNFFPPQE